MRLHGSPWLEASEDVRKYALYKVLKFPLPLVFDRSHSSCNRPNTSSCGMLWMKTQRNPALNRQPPWRGNCWLMSSFLRWAAGSLENFQLWFWEPLSFYLHFCWVWRKGNDPDISQHVDTWLQMIISSEAISPMNTRMALTSGLSGKPLLWVARMFLAARIRKTGGPTTSPRKRIHIQHIPNPPLYWGQCLAVKGWSGKRLGSLRKKRYWNHLQQYTAMRKSQLFLGNHIQIRDVGGCFITTFIAPASMIPARCKDQGVFRFDSIWSDPIHLMAVNCILYMLHSLILCKGMLAIEPSMLLRVAKLSGAVISWEPDLSEGPALAKMSHENDLWGCLSLENTSWTWAWHLRRIWLLQIDVVCMLVAWNVQWKNRQFHIESLLLSSTPLIFFRILPENYHQKMIPEMDRNGLCKISSVDQSGENLQPTNQTGQPTN